MNIYFNKTNQKCNMLKHPSIYSLDLTQDTGHGESLYFGWRSGP